MPVDFSLLWPQFLLAGLALLVLTADFFLPPERKAWLGGLAVIGMLGILGFSIPYLQGRDTNLYDGILQVDSFTLFFMGFFLILGVAIILMSLDYVRRHLSHPGEYYGIIIFSVLAMIFMAGAGELLTAYIALELLSFSLYILVSFARENPKSNEAGTKYILLGAFSSALLLYGISLIYGNLGETRYDAIASALSQPGAVSPQLLVGLTLVLAGLGFKVAAVPFHMWAPDAYEGAPTPITAYLAVGSKAASFALVLRLFSEAFLPAVEQWQVLVALLAALTMTLGNVVAIAQHNIKRLLAYSSIGQVGYLLVGVAALSLDPEQARQASTAVIFHLAGYGVANLAIFMAIIAYFNLSGKEEIGDFAGLGSRAPFLALTMSVALFSLAGLPFFAGFTTKFFLFTAAAQGGLLWLAGLAIVNSLISLYYYLVIVRQIYIEKGAETTPLRVPLLATGVMGLLVVGVFFIGVYPSPLVNSIETASRVILPGLQALVTVGGG